MGVSFGKIRSVHLLTVGCALMAGAPEMAQARFSLFGGANFSRPGLMRDNVPAGAKSQTAPCGGVALEFGFNSWLGMEVENIYLERKYSYSDSKGASYVDSL